MIAVSAATTLGSRCRGHIAGHRCLQHVIHQSPSLSHIGIILPAGRAYSSSTKLEQDERKWTLLYNRNPSRMTYPRALLGISSFNITYWAWYNLDFTPSVNGSAYEKAALGQIDQETLEMLLIDPNMGYVGLGMASVIWIGSFFYTKQLVSAIWASKKSPGDEESLLAVSALKLPFLTRPKILGKTVYDPELNNFGAVENIVFTDSELQSESSVEVFEPGELSLSEDIRKNDVIVKFDGEFSKLKGHIALKKDDESGEKGPLASLLQQKYLLDIDSENEFMPNASPTLLRSLVLEDYHLNVDKKVGRSSTRKLAKAGSEADGPVETTSIKLKKGFRKRRR